MEHMARIALLLCFLWLVSGQEDCVPFADTLPTPTPTPRECEDQPGEVCDGIVLSPGNPCDVFLSAKCPRTCQVCDFPCVDQDFLIEFLNPINPGAGGTCASNVENCDHPEHGLFFQLYCPVTCHGCQEPEPLPYVCMDRSAELQEFTDQIAITCDFVGENGLCEGPNTLFYRAYCPISCGECDRPCEDDDTKVPEMGLDDITTCTQIASNNLCDTLYLDRAMSLYCPDSCGSCNDQGVIPVVCLESLTPTPSPSPSITMSPIALPTSCSPTPSPSCTDDDAEIVRLAASVDIIIPGCRFITGFCDHISFGTIIREVCPVSCHTCNPPSPSITPSPSSTRTPADCDNDDERIIRLAATIDIQLPNGCLDVAQFCNFNSYRDILHTVCPGTCDPLCS